MCFIVVSVLLIVAGAMLFAIGSSMPRATYKPLEIKPDVVPAEVAAEMMRLMSEPDKWDRARGGFGDMVTRGNASIHHDWFPGTPRYAFFAGSVLYRLGGELDVAARRIFDHMATVEKTESDERALASLKGVV